MQVRPAEPSEVDGLAKLWYDAWHESHAHLMPAELTRLRTLASFTERLEAALPTIRAVGPRGAPVGFCIVKGNELYQLFVSQESRGSGAAAALIADAEIGCARRGSKQPGSHVRSRRSQPNHTKG